VVVRLPVSGIDVEVRAPEGVEDVMLAEAAALNVELAIGVAAGLTTPVDGTPVPWATLPHSDVDAALLHARSLVFGDQIRATARCPGEGCGAQIAVSLSTAGYLLHHTPADPGRIDGIEPAAEPGWFRLVGSGVTFRVPAAADVAAVSGDSHGDRRLLERCVRPGGIDARTRRRVERAMERLAPSLVEDVTGECPECGAGIAMRFDPLDYCLRELRDQAFSVYGDVHILACVYHWSEDRILSLPRARRLRYAEMAREERWSA
jgi:hypothetical protein